MTAPRDVEEIRADVRIVHAAPLHLDSDGAYRGPGPTTYALARLFADVEPLLARLAAADQQNAELRGELDAARRWQAKRVVAISQDPTCLKWMHESERMLVEVEAAEAERDDLRAQLAAAQATIVSLAAEDDPEQIARFRQRFPNAQTFDAGLPAALSAAPQPEPDVHHFSRGYPISEAEHAWDTASDALARCAHGICTHRAGHAEAHGHDCVPEGCSECRTPAPQPEPPSDEPDDQSDSPNVGSPADEDGTR